jgi:hypothetical protein
MEIKPIETAYNGYLFRSRLEARWAVFFDAAHIEYEYEPEGFELNDGTKYLPDFYLPDYKWYAEVKAPRDGIENDMQRMLKFIGKGIDVLLLLGNIPPKVKVPCWHFHALHYNSLMEEVMCGSVAFRKYESGSCFEKSLYIDRMHEIPTWGFTRPETVEDAFTAIHDRELFDKYIGKDDLAWCETWDEESIKSTSALFNKARRARFEFDERNAV